MNVRKPRSTGPPETSFNAYALSVDNFGESLFYSKNESTGQPETHTCVYTLDFQLSFFAYNSEFFY
ncbi:hypothetical protein ACVLD2_001229 [Paenibacillus sp. PvR052]|nr:hypothetical protein [Paenibacillus sp. PvP091]MBP1169755.1 hypothetical protein [Paenibacillus sp. PvR098]MBP2440783.1 hypothetical protein [Paenibacillus sp. PvP052]